MSVSSTYDIDRAANELISRLADAGRENEAAMLRSAIENGSTATEILMALRFSMERIAGTDAIVPDDVLFSTLRRELERALRD
jgi:hypothetical protein